MTKAKAREAEKKKDEAVDNNFNSTTTNKPKPKRKLVSSTCASFVLFLFYIFMTCKSLYGIMYPLSRLEKLVDFSDTSQMVHPLWEQQETPLQVRVYLSTHPEFQTSMVASEFSSETQRQQEDSSEEDPPSPSTIERDESTVLLWKQSIESASYHNSLLLSTCEGDDAESCQSDASHQQAERILQEAEDLHSSSNEGLLSTLQSAGQGIESTSILLTAYQSLVTGVSKGLSKLGLMELEDSSVPADDSLENQRTMIHLPKSSPIWRQLQTNGTAHVHVVVTRPGQVTSEASNADQVINSMRRAAQAQSLLFGQVSMIKFEPPHHISKPGRRLIQDVIYVWNKYILKSVEDAATPAPWDMEHSQPEFYRTYQWAQEAKETNTGAPYWKPQVAIHYLIDPESYPMDYSHLSGMSLVRVPASTSKQKHPTGIAHIPALYVDEIGLTSDKYIPMNETVTAVPLRISFDRSDTIDPTVRRTTATAGGMSPARWRLLSHLSESIESQKSLGFEQSDIDDVRRLIADTNVTLLAITMLASALHLLFEFLTFQSEVSFWKSNTDLTGLSVRSLFLDFFGQVIIVLFLIETNSSLLMTVPSAFGCLIALWKCQRAAGLAFRKPTPEYPSNGSWWNFLPRLAGYELRATRLEAFEAKHKQAKNESSADNGQDLHTLTMESDRVATKTLGRVFLPLVLIYTVYSLVFEEHTGWYSWLITSASSAVYALGFVLMTPQLFLNYKLKSVAHLPWKVLIYKSLDTFIDDLFSFIIRMPTMARLSCFRDDVVFFVYLYQRWLYPVDTSRPVEGLGEEMPANVGDGHVADARKKNQ